ncbi:MAG: Acetyltransferase (GNAT) family protein [Firmicutes bacterium ADurb.Bin419]|nr:MAG: Acetyltransferase (GNAT) family protein [Firmicutes bacterium ADurb.Bin419]
MDNITFITGFKNMDFVKVTEMLSKTYWTPGIGMEEVKRGAENSALVIGAFTENQIQVGYSRVISDKTRFAYILDVIVDENYRKKGIGQKMIKAIMEDCELKDVYQWLLITKDAHGVYDKVGFKPISRPLDWMEIRYDRSKFR